MMFASKSSAKTVQKKVLFQVMSMLQTPGGGEEVGGKRDEKKKEIGEKAPKFCLLLKMAWIMVKARL